MLSFTSSHYITPNGIWAYTYRILVGRKSSCKKKYTIVVGYTIYPSHLMHFRYNIIFSTFLKHCKAVAHKGAFKKVGGCHQILNWQHFIDALLKRVAQMIIFSWFILPPNYFNIIWCLEPNRDK